MTRINQGKVDDYKRAHDTAWKWIVIVDHPLSKKSPAWDKWSGYYEDQPHDTDNVNDMDSMLVAFYILSKDDPASVDPDWRAHVRHLIDSGRLLLGHEPFFGAWGIDELHPDDLPAGGGDDALRKPADALLGTDNRRCCTSVGLICRIANWAAINATFYEKTGDAQSLEDAYRSLNYATYFHLDNGEISCCGLDFDEYWFEDGHADAGRDFMWAVSAVPAFAPARQDQLLRSLSIVQKATHSARDIQYQTFDKADTEKFHLTFKPTRITAGNQPLQLRDNLDGGQGRIRRQGSGGRRLRSAAPIATPMMFTRKASRGGSLLAERPRGSSCGG